jgi:hypothetical protein
MTRVWFKPLGWLYRPSSWQAVVLVFLAAFCCVQVFVAVDRHSHSVTDTLYGVFPFVVPCLLDLNWVASRTSQPERCWDEIGVRSAFPTPLIDQSCTVSGAIARFAAVQSHGRL